MHSSLPGMSLALSSMHLAEQLNSLLQDIMAAHMAVLHIPQDLAGRYCGVLASTISGLDKTERNISLHNSLVDYMFFNIRQLHKTYVLYPVIVDARFFYFLTFFQVHTEIIAVGIYNAPEEIDLHAINQEILEGLKESSISVLLDVYRTASNIKIDLENLLSLSQYEIGQLMQLDDLEIPAELPNHAARKIVKNLKRKRGVMSPAAKHPRGSVSSNDVDKLSQSFEKILTRRAATLTLSAAQQVTAKMYLIMLKTPANIMKHRNNSSYFNEILMSYAVYFAGDKNYHEAITLLRQMQDHLSFGSDAQFQTLISKIILLLESLLGKSKA
jgi:hypothetical protein